MLHQSLLFYIHGLGAFNLIVLCVMGFVFTSIGGLICGNAAYWAIHALRVTGTLIGVRQLGGSFYNVYRYTLPSGATQEGTTDQGSNSIGGRITGASVPLWVMPENPDQVAEARSHVVTAVGAVFLAVGLGLFRMAVGALPKDPMSWLIVGVILAYFAFKIIRRIRTPRPAGPKLDAAERRPGIEDRPIQQIEDLQVEFSSVQAADEQRAASWRRAAPVMTVIGLALIAGAGFVGRSLLRLEISGARAPGIVQSLETSGSASRNAAYYPRVQYADQNGSVVRFRDSTGTNPPMYRVGEHVTVLYSPQDYGASVMIDRGVWNWLPSLLMLAFGAALGIGGLRTWVKR